MNNSTKYTLAMIAGAVGGVAIGLLTAPMRGKDTRAMIGKEISNTANELEELASTKYNDAKEVISEAVKAKLEFSNS